VSGMKRCMTKWPHEVAEPYLDAYCQVAHVRRQTILDWLPYIAAARLAEDVPGEQHSLLELIRSE
jgi:hypothetical protein